MIAIILLLIGCVEDSGPCPDGLKEVHYRFSSDTTAIPYNGNDSLYFEIRDKDSNIIDTVLFISGPKVYYNAHIQGPMCVKGNALGDAFSLTFKSQNWSDSIVIAYTTEEYIETIKIRYKKYEFLYSAGWLQGTFGYDYNVIQVANNTYFNIIRSCDNDNSPQGECWRYPMFMNIPDGIIYFKCHQGDIFALVKK